MQAHLLAPKERALALVESFLKETPDDFGQSGERRRVDRPLDPRQAHGIEPPVR
jgi:hypothetical protein